MNLIYIIVIILILSLFVFMSFRNVVIDTFLTESIDYSMYPYSKITYKLKNQHNLCTDSSCIISNENEVYNVQTNLYNFLNNTPDTNTSTKSDDPPPSVPSDASKYFDNTKSDVQIGNWSCSNNTYGCRKFCDDSPLPKQMCLKPKTLTDASDTTPKPKCVKGGDDGWKFNGYVVYQDGNDQCGIRYGNNVSDSCYSVPSDTNVLTGVSQNPDFNVVSEPSNVYTPSYLSTYPSSLVV